jgi:hypothetical protein
VKRPITEPHGHREDCSLCESTLILRYCDRCEKPAVVLINGHATANDHVEIARDSCGVDMRELARHKGIDARDSVAISALVNAHPWPSPGAE